MSDDKRKELVAQLKEICREIGCSGVGPSCDTHPQNCQIIRKLLMPPKEKKPEGAQ